MHAYGFPAVFPYVFTYGTIFIFFDVMAYLLPYRILWIPLWICFVSISRFFDVAAHDCKAYKNPPPQRLSIYRVSPQNLLKKRKRGVQGGK